MQLVWKTESDNSSQMLLSAKKRMGVLDAAVQGLTAEITKQQNSLDSETKKASGLNQKSNWTALLQNLNSQIDSARAQQADLKKLRSNIVKQMAVVSSQLQTDAPTLVAISTRQANLTKKLDDLVASQQATEQKESDVTARLSTLLEVGSTKEKEIAAAKSALAQAELQQKQLMQQQSTLAALKKSLETQLEDANTNLTTTQKKLLDLQSQASAANQQIISNSQGIAQLQTQVVNAQSQQDSVQKTISALQQQLTLVQASKASLQTETDSLTAQKLALQKQIQGEPAAAAAELTALKSRAASLINQLQDAQSQLQVKRFFNIL